MEKQRREVDVPYIEHFEGCFACTTRYLNLWGGAGSGKSYTACQKIIKRSLQEQGHRFLCVRKVKDKIRDSVYKLFTDLLSQYELNNLFTVNQSYMAFRFNNGNEIITAGLDDAEKLKSIQGITGIWVEEATELEQGDFMQLDLRLRGQTNHYKQIITTFNPIDEDHWIKKMMFDEQNASITNHWSNYQHNPFLDDDYVRLLNEKISANENYYRIYKLGLWGRLITGGEFYSQFRYSEHVDNAIEYANEMPLHISFDQNVVPYITCLVSQIVKEDDTYYINFIDELCLSNPLNNTHSLCRKLIETYGDRLRYLFYYGDASGRQRDTRGKENDYDIVKRTLSQYLTNDSSRVPYSNPPLSKRRDFINRILSNQYQIRIRIHPRCKNLILDMGNVKEDADGTKLKARYKDKETQQTYEKYGHTSDAMDYLICSAFKPFFKH